MAFVLDVQGEIFVLALSGRMDAVSAPDFDKEVEKLLAEGAGKYLVDFSGLDYISSAGLRSMLMLAKKVKPLGGSVVLCGLNGMVKNVFDVSGFAPIFTITENREEAMGRLA